MGFTDKELREMLERATRMGMAEQVRRIQDLIDRRKA